MALLWLGRGAHARGAALAHCSPPSGSGSLLSHLNPPHMMTAGWLALSSVTHSKRSSTRAFSQQAPFGLPGAYTNSESSYRNLSASHDSADSLLSMYARKQPTGVSLKQMFEQGQKCDHKAMLKSARFLYRELPARFARRARELDNLPYGLSEKEPINIVRSLYVQSFKEILSRREPESMADELEFTALIDKINSRHRNVVMMAKGILELKNEMGSEAVECPFLQDFLDRFYMSRIGIRMLMQQHLALHHPAAGFVGIIGEAVSPFQVADLAIVDCTRMCESAYGVAPDVQILGGKSLVFRYVPEHLHYMMIELIKNSMRAVVEFHGTSCDNLPPIEIVIADGVSDVTIKVSDQGGGIPRKDIKKIWTYLYTTAQQPDVAQLSQLDTGWTPTSIMAGLGYGLPMCRLFARYFGGDLELVSMHPHGTDVYLYLNKLGDSEEALPV